MPRYPAQPLEEKLAWMRERQRQRQAAEVYEAPPRRPLTPAKYERRQKLGEIPRMLRVGEVAEQLGVSRHSVSRWLRDRGVFVGQGSRRIMLISQQDLEDWKREHRLTAP